MKISIITLFPDLLKSFICTSIVGRAVNKDLVQFELVDLRQFGEGRHQVVDDRPFGGGPGMVLKADILERAWKSIISDEAHTVLMSASGIPYKQAAAQALSQKSHLIVIAGHYEGVDQRFIDQYVDEEISIGDYVLTGGEIPAMVVIDSIIRLIPGVLKKEEATQEESFSPTLQGLLEYPQYTRPETFNNQGVPAVLVSGNHQEIKKWRQQKSLEKTRQTRPDLVKRILLSQKNCRL